MLKRLELPDGQWADLLVTPKHADMVAILRAVEAVSEGTMSDVDWAVLVGQRYTRGWHIRDDDGTDIPHPEWDRLDADLSDALQTEALNRWKEWRETRTPLVVARPWKTTSPSATSSASTPEASPSTSPT